MAIAPYPANFVLVAAAGLDYLLGDPWTWTHPVQAMGYVIAWGRDRTWALSARLAPEHRPGMERAAGVILALGTIAGSGLVGWSLIRLASTLHPWLGMGLEIVLLAACFAGRSLRDAAEDVLAAVEGSDLDTARSRLARYVGRDTETLSEAEILRAVLETVAENAIDGVIAPLLWALAAAIACQVLGVRQPAGAIAAVTLAYKAASTLDSMVGYRKAPYTHLGWASAKIEDGLTWVPCRLAVGAIALISRRPGRVLALCRRDGPQDPSPNSGWSECAYAAALGVQLGGENFYGGQLIQKPLLGEAERAITPTVIREAIALTRWVFLGWLGLGAGAIAWISAILR